MVKQGKQIHPNSQLICAVPKCLARNKTPDYALPLSHRFLENFPFGNNFFGKKAL